MGSSARNWCHGTRVLVDIASQWDDGPMGVGRAFSTILPAMFGATVMIAGAAGHPDPAALGNAPDFSWASGQPLSKGCVPMAEWNMRVSVLAQGDLGRIPPESVVVHLDGSIERVDTRIAWRDALTAPPSTYWIIGACEKAPRSHSLGPLTHARRASGYESHQPAERRSDLTSGE